MGCQKRFCTVCAIRLDAEHHSIAVSHQSARAAPIALCNAPHTENARPEATNQDERMHDSFLRVSKKEMEDVTQGRTYQVATLRWCSCDGRHRWRGCDARANQGGVMRRERRTWSNGRRARGVHACEGWCHSDMLCAEHGASKA